MDYLRHKDKYDLAIFFEDIVSNPEQEIKKIFDLMNIDNLHVPKALEALKEDSQRGTFGPRGKRPKISDEEYAYLDSCLRSCEVDESITCKMDLASLKELVEVNKAVEVNKSATAVEQRITCSTDFASLKELVGVNKSVQPTFDPSSYEERRSAQKDSVSGQTRLSGEIIFRGHNSPGR